jgi:gliding motility-associated-like protein
MSDFSFLKYLVLTTILFFLSGSIYAQNLLMNGDFEEGDISGFDVSGNGYDQLFPPFSGNTNPGDFALVSDPQDMNTNFFISAGDHTTGNGLMLAFDGNNLGGQQRLWRAGDGGTGLCCLQIGTTYRFSYWVKSIATSVTNPSTQANIDIEITNASNITLTSGQTQVSLPVEGWEQVTYSFTATSNCVSIELWNTNTNTVGNDFAIDDMLLVSLDDPLDATYSLIDLYCPQSLNGFVAIYPLGGVPPYVYTITRPGFVASNTLGTFEDLEPGIYQVEVTDDVGDKISFTLEILAPEPELSVSPNQVICFGETTTIEAFSDYPITSWTSTPNDESIVEIDEYTLEVTPMETTVYDVEIEYDVDIDFIYNGDFSLENEGFTTDYLYLDSNTSGNQGVYGVVENSNTWFSPLDDCTAQTGTNFFAADGATENNCDDRVWCQTANIIPGNEYEFIYWIQTLDDVDINPANIEVEINGVSIGQNLSPTVGCTWEERIYAWNSGGNTEVEICIYNREKEADGNNFGLDNIQFLTTETCIEIQRIRVQVDNCFCPEIENPQGTQTVCQEEALSPISADIILEDFEDQISFVYFSSPQVGNEMYQNGTLLGQQLASSTATYNFPPLGQANSLPNVPGTYYVYAILTNLPFNPNCRPFAEFIITIEELITPVFTLPEVVCSIDEITLPSISENNIEGTWSPTNLLSTTGIYTFTPLLSDECIEIIETQILVTQDEVPEFDLPTNICLDGFIEFPSVSLNGYEGTWSPPFDPTQETTYTFTPLLGECTEQIYSVTIGTQEIIYNEILTPLEACDNNNNGFFAGFDLNSRIDEVTFSNPELEVTFHLTENDAITDINPVPSPYSNVNPSEQTLYVRVENPDNNCYKTTSLDLIVYDSPLLEELEPLVVCDTFEVGINFFDLTSVEENLFVPGQDTTDFEISYHISQTSALNNVNPIDIPTNYLMEINPQTVYVRVSDPSSPLQCFNIQPLQLIVEPLPQITPPSSISLCEDLSLDEPFASAIFDLSSKIPEISNDDNALIVEFYENETDQENNIPITDTENYQNTQNPQNILITVFSPDTECVATTFLTLITSPTPSIPEPEPLVVCDADNEGTSEFDLLAAIDVILDGESNTEVTFHLTEVEANNDQSPIAIEDEDGNSILYQNINPFSQTLYVRAEYNGNPNPSDTDCYTVVALELEVRVSPIIQELDDLVICDDDTLNGFAVFDLTQNSANAIGNQDASILNVTYHKTQAQAVAGTNAIAVPSNFTNDTNPQTIYVRLTDIESECIDLFGFTDDNSFTISVEPYPDLSAPTILDVCNTYSNPDANFPTGNFDLTSTEEEMTGLSPIPANIVFAYYENQTDLDNQENAIEDPTDYVNATNPPMSIFVEATDTSTQNQCINTIAIIIDVLPVPFPVELTEEELRLTACDDDSDGVAVEAFDLTQIGQQITGSENNTGSYYLTEDAAINQDTDQQILNPTAYVNDPSLNEVDENFFPTNTQIIWVRLDSNADGNFCFQIVSIEIVVEPNPEINPAGMPFGYTLCEGDPTQLPTAEEIAFSLYDVTNGSPSAIIPVLDPANEEQDLANFEFSFHLSEADAEEGINPLAVGYQADSGEILYLRVTHIITGCYNIGNIAEVQITIEPRPDITDEDIMTIVVCADEQLNDSAQADNQDLATVDLTQKDEEIDPNFNDEDSNTMVEYYASQEDFENGIPITDPTSFITTESPTTIIAEVVDLDNFCTSLTTQSFEVQINPLPLVDITAWDRAIICIDPQTGEVIVTDFSPPVIDTQLSEEFYSFEWTRNDESIAFTGSVYTPTQAGVYTVTVTDITNNITSCQASSTAEIIQSNGPSFEVNILSLSFDGSHSVEVTNIQGDGDYEFSIDNGPWISLEEGETSIVFNNLEAGERIVRGRDNGGCGEVEISIYLIDYPLFFTPNEDGFNDTWNIIGLEDQRNAKIYVFDRFGKLIKQLSPTGPGWNGTYNGKPMISNDYWFRVEFIEPSTGQKRLFRANFTLKR